LKNTARILRVIVVAIFGVALLLMCSCSAQKRLNRLVRKNPELVKTEIITHRDTIVVQGVKVDTVFSFKEFYTHVLDTLRIEKDHFRVDIYHDTVTNQIFIDGECDTVHVPYEVQIEVPTIIMEELSWWKRNSWWIYLAIAGAVALYILYKRKGQDITLRFKSTEDNDST